MGIDEIGFQRADVFDTQAGRDWVTPTRTTECTTFSLMIASASSALAGLGNEYDAIARPHRDRQGILDPAALTNCSTMAGFSEGSAHFSIGAASSMMSRVYILKERTSGLSKRRAQASTLARWMSTISVPSVHQPFPTATMTSGSWAID